MTNDDGLRSHKGRQSQALHIVSHGKMGNSEWMLNVQDDDKDTVTHRGTRRQRISYMSVHGFSFGQITDLKYV